jgi:hypothetical protein
VGRVRRHSTRVFVSGAYIGQFEQAIRKPQLDIAQRIDEVLQTDGFFGRLCKKLVDESRYAIYFAAAAELEALATRICDFAPAVVPGLLQTPEYARALARAENPFASDEFIEDTVRARIDRGQILRSTTRPPYWGILHECVLRIPVGGPAVMAEQLDHVVSLIHSRTVLVQVVPFSAGAHAAMGKMMRLMEFKEAPPTAYTEAVYSSWRTCGAERGSGPDVGMFPIPAGRPGRRPDGATGSSQPAWHWSPSCRVCDC